MPLIATLAILILCLLPVGGRRLNLGFLARWIAAEVVSLIVFAPWVITFLRAPHATPRVLYPIDLFTFLWAGATVFPLGVSAYLERYTLATLAALALLCLAGPVLARRAYQRAGVLFAALFVLPPFIVYAMSFPNPVLYGPNLSVRYLLVFLPVYHLLLAVAVVFLWQPARVWLSATRDKGPRRVTGLAVRGLPAAAACLMIGGMTVWGMARYYPERRLLDDGQTVAAYLRAYARPGDALVLNPDWDWPVFRYYYPGDLPVYGVNNYAPIAPEAAANLLDSALAKHDSLWLLTSFDAFDSDPAGDIPAWLDGHARLVGKVAGPHRTLALYSTDSSRTVDVPLTAQPRHAVGATFTSSLKLLGYDLPVREIAAGEDLRMAVYWQIPKASPPDTQAILKLVDHAGTVFRQLRLPATLLPQPTRASDAIRRMDYTIAVPKAMPSGSYLLTLGVQSLSVDELLATGDTAAVLGSIRVVGSQSFGNPPMAERKLNVMLGDDIALAGYDLAFVPERSIFKESPANASFSGETALRVRLYWQDIQAVDRPYAVFLQLVGDQVNPATGNPVWSQRDGFPVQGKKPTDSWVPGETIEDDYELALPATAPNGHYYLQVGLYDQQTGQRLPVTEAGHATGADKLVLVAGDRK